MKSKQALQMRIMELAVERDLTINALARVSGITQSTLNNITCGRNNSATIATIQKLCDGLEIDLPTFFDSKLFRNLDQEVD